MNAKLVISILTDESSWMNHYNEALEAQLNAQGHEVRLAKTKNELAEGDIAFFLSCFEVVQEKFLSRNRHNIVVHASQLPRGKGWSPATWQILEGRDELPLTLFEATKDVDAGDVYLRDSISLDGTELLEEWRDKLGVKIVEMCLTFTKLYLAAELVALKQEGEESFYPQRRPEDSRLDSYKSIADQFNLLRVADNERYPAFFEYKGSTYKVSISKWK